MTDKDFDPSHAFHVGMDVVCVDDGYTAEQRVSIQCELVLNLIYKLRWIGIYNHYLDGEYLGVRLFGMDRGKCKIWGYDDVPFKAIRFRPLVVDPLAVFRNMTAPVPHGEGRYAPSAPEGPLHPDGPWPEGPRRNKKLPGRGPARETVKEEVE